MLCAELLRSDNFFSKAESEKPDMVEDGVELKNGSLSLPCSPASLVSDNRSSLLFVCVCCVYVVVMIPSFLRLISQDFLPASVRHFCHCWYGRVSSPVHLATEVSHLERKLVFSPSDCVA